MNLRDVDTQRVRYDFLIVDSFAARAELKLAAGELDAARTILAKAFPRVGERRRAKGNRGKVEPASSMAGCFTPKAVRMMQSH